MSWWATAPALELAVPCEGARHRLQWSAGRVVVPDHPDLDAELALIGFGAPEPACLGLQRLWSDAVADGGFLAEWADETNLGPARRSWLTMALERMANEGFHEFLRDLPHARAERMGHFLHRFPRPWLDRAAGAVSAAVADGSGVTCERAPGLLDDAVATRLRRSFVEAVAGHRMAVGAAALVPLTPIAGPGRSAAVAGRLRGLDRGVTLTVATDWLHDVWAAGAAVIDGHLVLARRGSEMAVATWPHAGAGGEADEPGDGEPRLRWLAAHFEDGAWRFDDRDLRPEDGARRLDGRARHLEDTADRSPSSPVAPGTSC